MKNTRRYKIRLKKGDMVIIRSGKYRGHSGKIVKVFPMTNKVSIEGANVVKRHLKPSRTNPGGGISEITKPLYVSQVAIYDPSTKKASKINYQLGKDGSKKRTYKHSGKEVKS